MKLYSATTLFPLLSLSSCLDNATAVLLRNRRQQRGAVFTMTNEVNEPGNAIVAFERSEDGSLAFAGKYETGGLGGLTAGDVEGITAGPEEDPLASQQSLVLSENNQCLFAVNAGSDTFTSFRVVRLGHSVQLKRVDVVPSGGSFPVSIARNRGQLFVLNAGGEGTVTGFKYHNTRCTIEAVEGSMASLSNNLTNPPFFLYSPAQISFDPNGMNLIVTNKGEDKIVSIEVLDTGLLGDVVENESNGKIPFGFDFDKNGNLLVSEIFGAQPFGTESAGAVSSYALAEESGTVDVVSASVSNQQTASCWLKYFDGVVFVTNNVDATVSTYTVDTDGNLELLEAVAANTGSSTTDLDLTDDGRFVYVLNAGPGSISVFANNDGELEFVEEIAGVADNIEDRDGEGPAGMAAF